MLAAPRSAHGRLPPPSTLRAGPSPLRSGASPRPGASPWPGASPFENPLILWLLAAVAAVQFFHQAGLADVVLRLRLPDNDDVMRLVAVRDLLHGQAWFDPVQHRHLPPGGVVSHWSRLVDAPIAGLILALAPLMGERLAEGVVAALWPALLFVLFCGLAFAGSRRVFGTRAAILAVFAACQTGAFVGIFAYGRIDHHNVQACAVLGIGLLLFRADGPGASAWRSRALAGGLCAASLAVGLETLPFVAAAGFVAAFDWVRSGRGRPFAAFGLAFAAGALGLFLAQTAPALYAVSYCDALSRPWLWLAGAAAVAALALAASPARTPLARAGLAALAGAVVAGSFVALYPACATSPFGDLPALVRSEWLSQVAEMKPIWHVLREKPASALGNAMPILVAALVATAFALRGRGPRARACAVAAALLWPGVGITLFQVRGIYVGSAFVPVVAGVALDRALAMLRTEGVARWRRAGLLAVALMTLGKAWAFAVVIPPVAIGALSGAPTGGAPPTAVADDTSVEDWLVCTDPARLAALDALAPTTILAPLDLGTNLLLHTRHAIVAAPYHRAVAGLMADLEGLSGDEATLRRHVAATGAGLVLLCDPWLAKAKERLPGAFATRLGRGEATAAWLAPVDLPPGPLKAWRVTAGP